MTIDSVMGRYKADRNFHQPHGYPDVMQARSTMLMKMKDNVGDFQV